MKIKLFTLSQHSRDYMVSVHHLQVQWSCDRQRYEWSSQKLISGNPKNLRLHKSDILVVKESFFLRHRLR